VLWKLFSNRDLLGIVIGVSLTDASVCAVSEDLSLVSFCTTFPRSGCVGDILTSAHFPPAVGHQKRCEQSKDGNSQVHTGSWQLLFI